MSAPALYRVRIRRTASWWDDFPWEAEVSADRAPRCVRDKGCRRAHVECDVCGRYRHDLPHHDGDKAWCHICAVTNSPWGSWPYRATTQGDTTR